MLEESTRVYIILYYLNRFDKTNPRKLNKEEHRFHMRILYMECLCIMRFHEDIWYDFAMFENSFDDIASSKQVQLYIYSI